MAWRCAAGADARQHQHLRRVDGPAAQDDLARGAQHVLAGPVAIGDADGAAILDHHAHHLRPGDEAEVAVPLQGRLEIGGGSRAAQAVAGGRLVPAGAFLLRAVEVVIAREAEFQGCLQEGLGERVPVAQVADVERPAAAMQLALAMLVRLGALEIGQAVGEGPAGAAELAPVVVILGLAADVDEPVDCRGAAQHAPARPGNGAPVQFALGLGLVVPAQRRVIHRPGVADRDVEPGVAVQGARFQHRDAQRRVLAEAACQGRAGRAAAHHDDVGVHAVLPPSDRRECSAWRSAGSMA
jgi:hypothetical protein